MNWIEHNGSSERPAGVGPNDHIAYVTWWGVEGDERALTAVWAHIQKYHVMFAGRGIGDVTSTAPGTAARYNANKPRLDLIPGSIVGTYLEHVARFGRAGNEPNVPLALCFLGAFQMGDDRSADALRNALAALDHDGRILDECAAVFEYGLGKYAAWNWAKGMPWSVPVGCAMRHLAAMARGESVDAESDHPHRGHAACNLVMLLWYLDHWAAGDDLRPLLFVETK